MIQFVFNQTIKNFCFVLESDKEIEESINSSIFAGVKGETYHFEIQNEDEEKSLREKYLKEGYIEKDYCTWGA